MVAIGNLRAVLDRLWQDIRFAFRMLRKSPLHSGVAILTIALGVSQTTHTFSIVYGAAIAGLPYEGADRLMAITVTNTGNGSTQNSVTPHDFEAWRQQQTAFEDLAAFYWSTVNLADDDQNPERVLGAAVTSNVFQQVGVQPILGRFFVEGEDSPYAPQTMVISWDVWQNRYGGDSTIIGRSVRANGTPHTVIGVMPEGVLFPFDNYVWVPLGLDVGQLERGDGQQVVVVGRLRIGQTREAGLADIKRISDRLAVEYPTTNAGLEPEVYPFTQRYMPSQILAVLWAMLVAVFGVLLIACFNVANLLMARAAERTKEVAIRSALGASRLAVVRQLLVESTLIALLGGALGVAVAAYGIDVYAAVTADIQKPYWLTSDLNASVVVFALVVTIVASLVSGAMPALSASSRDVGDILKDESRGSSGLRMSRFTSGLVVSEIALSCALLVAAGFMVKSVVKVKTLDMGFETDKVFTAELRLMDTEYPHSGDLHRFEVDLMERLESIASARYVAITTTFPGTGGPDVRFSREGDAYVEELDYPQTKYAAVTQRFFDVFDVGVLDGRVFGNGDGPDGLPVVVVNESFRLKYFGGESAIGKRIRLGTAENLEPWLSVVGVVPDLHVGGGVGGIGSDTESPEQLYVPLAQHPSRTVRIAIKTTGNPLDVTTEVRQAVAGLDPNLPIFRVNTMDEVIERFTWAFGLFGGLFSVFGVMALFMAAVGLYGVMAFSVRLRTQEIGIRIALGADTFRVLRIVLGRGLRQLALGIVAGLAMGIALSRPLRFVLFDVDTSDISVYLAIVVTLTLTGALACFLPARRATKIDIVDALRPE